MLLKTSTVHLPLNKLIALLLLGPDFMTWTSQQWSTVSLNWLSKIRFIMSFNVGRQHRQRFHDATVREHDRYGCGSIMVWRSFTINYISSLNCRRQPEEALGIETILSVLLYSQHFILLGKIVYSSSTLSQWWTGQQTHLISTIISISGTSRYDQQEVTSTNCFKTCRRSGRRFPQHIIRRLVLFRRLTLFMRQFCLWSTCGA